MVTGQRKLKLILSYLSAFLMMSVPLLVAQTSARTSDGYLRDWQNDGDHVAFSTENGTVRSVMTSDEERLMLRLYDEYHRLTSETIWADGYEIITSETKWTYSGTNVFPETMTKNLAGQNQKIEVLYYESGLEKERSVWKTAENQADELIEKSEWQYDSEKRVICKIHESHDAEKENRSLTERTEYVYTEKSPDPDTICYENDVLVEKVEWTSENTYIDSLYFEDMEIRTTWVDGVRIEEVYYLDGKEFKRKSL